MLDGGGTNKAFTYKSGRVALEENKLLAMSVIDDKPDEELRHTSFLHQSMPQPKAKKQAPIDLDKPLAEDLAFKIDLSTKEYTLKKF